MNSLIVKNERIPKDWPYWYRNVNISGIATWNEKIIPAKNRLVIGII
jgi:hypothetical protein